MWISKQTYQDLYHEWQKCKAESEAQTRAAIGLRESNNWLMLRVTSLEKERAVFVERMFGVKIAVPELSPIPIVHDPFAENPLNETMSFEDVGDEAARQFGINHDSEGRVVYSK